MIQENTPAKVGLVELAAESLMQDLRQIIEQARNRVAYTANSELTMMYWHIGERINREVLGNERAEYGKQIVATVSTQLQTEYGRKGFEPRSIWRMMQFAQEFPDYSEKTLEDCLVAHLEQFIIELGNGFSFVARQKRMIIDGEDFKLDLLFYHRRLHRLIAIDLKLGRFKAEYKGQMELYLRWLEQNEMEPGEETPLGLLLCTEGSEEQIELLQLDKAGIKVAQYMTELPPREVLQRQIQKSLAEAKARLANYAEDNE